MLEKLKNLEINLFQNIALTGIVLSLMAQAGLFLLDKKVEHFWYVYAIWALVLIISSFIKVSGHHDHDHHH